jgi:uncharacterized oligopeptide transporter (OPT) family protein
MRPVFQADGEKQMKIHITNTPQHILFGLVLSIFAGAGELLGCRAIYFICTGILIGWEVCQAYLYAKINQLWFWAKNKLVDTFADFVAGMIGLTAGTWAIVSVWNILGA